MSNEGKRVLVIEDEESFIAALKVGLTREGFIVEVQSDGAAAFETFKTFNPDIVLLDLMLPNRSGIDICRDIREIAKTPIIMVTAKSEEIDTVLGLEVGADDYISKPYRLHELIARMRAQLRRTDWVDEPAVMYQLEKTVIGNISIDPNRHEVFKGDTQITLPLKEFELLLLLMRNSGQVLTRGILIDHIWGIDYYGDMKTLDVHIRRIRSKIEDNPSKPKKILTIRGLGYKYVDR
ncbi:MAG: DNA-binding response regulator [Acidimicrobiaceae bacterium]|nr:DNA-binding response regulator [Acidimicrobiaceae bacterium]|tara:strand:+ start:12281 stop:12988 length:708 start_codon:yes stop_codon:yes gene_type:complete